MAVIHIHRARLQPISNPNVLPVSEPDSRSTQHQYGAHFLQAGLLKVVAGSSQLVAASLEVFLVIDNQLGDKRGDTSRGDACRDL